ncbi:Protein N-acetyltransferase, RimJ/RimL family [Streptoalloteichus tenebrarius]|uniref:Protein N-acetyltransferase, RimJ/RimL family n=1 Tax=Streptoalloteichus tenebrarius (strain ATCC 17920 / DSM 40477 / JCM 4838 / CBS 697.72 / NBRC 16177 / NCIMB 11028 / NRRL B-12390 / A12253. 1 / ISP 5477) TaxID=1933 RepID=A0ABT1HM57_STRSD|nr:GNAT family N-acetyltransferase [Streptoalloteichus tenebrarius]MCP2256591.1 Protein N-acetyltransferase, RimJ/RimL family [Streptoalloteichus tenebrarius]BFF04944.1 hypothetical protein GCM10020241_66190 [Streptoalloteichus tenebrarius]
MSEIEVRPYAPADRAAVRELFERAGEGTPSGSIWGHPESEAAVYLMPYVEHAPETLLVALLDGEMVGYLAGCVDSSRFPSESARMTHAIRTYRLFLRPGPLAFFARAALDTVRCALRREPVPGDFTDPRWPAHLHINLVPRARGVGAGAALMRRWLDHLRAVESPGCHLQTLVENTRAVRFFARMGFEKHGPTPVVPGLRHHGRPVHQQTMVWSP